MELYLAITLSFLEITFILVGILFIHFIRKRIGQPAFYITLGALFVFIQFISVIQLKVIVGYPGADFYIANSVMFLPLLAAVMVVYITEGTLATQKLIVGTLVFFGFYIYLCYTTSIQCEWYGFKISQGPTAASFNYFLGQSLKNMTGSLAALCLDLFLIPIIYQRFRNLGARLYVAILGSLMLTQIFDSIVYITISYWNDPLWIEQMSSTYIARFIATIWLSFIMTAYIKYLEDDSSLEERKTLDIIFAFMGTYNKTKALEKNLVEWEDRYQMVVENASDMIFIANRKGEILDVNKSTLNTLNYTKGKLIGKSFFKLSETFKLLPCLWEHIWLDCEERNGKRSITTKQISLETKNKEKIEVELTFSKAFYKSLPVLIIFCRNITERNKLVKEKNDLKDQLYHTQRVESLGRLAGGIAHEFNNILHAIQGHIDITLLFGKIKNESASKHLNSVMGLVDKASNITSQLLGFARKREFREEVTDLRKVLNETKEMFLPLIKSSINFEIKELDDECKIKCDSIQLQQVFLNLFINAMDALENCNKEEKEIKVFLKKNDKFHPNWRSLKENIIPENYYLIIIEDNGEGMDEQTASKIFEPFFTTKEVGKGTGMGLAMVYGEITNHNGFIYVASKKNIGTKFKIYLPVYNEEEI